jgi:tol-pal system protein YbgF
VYLKVTQIILSGLILFGLNTCASRTDVVRIQEGIYYLRNQIQDIRQISEENREKLAKVPESLSQIPEIEARNAEILARLDSLDQSVAALQDATDRLRADVGVKLSGVKGDVGVVGSKLDDSSYRTDKLIGKVESLTNKMTDISEKLESQATKPAAAQGEPSPSEIFNNAYRDMSKGNMELAISGFQTFLELYPQNELADFCQYYIAEIAYQQSDFERAATEYTLLIDRYPRSQKIVNAQYKLGLCYLKMNEPSRASAYFNQVIQQYPNTEEALLSRSRLQKLAE